MKKTKKKNNDLKFIKYSAKNEFFFFNNLLIKKKDTPDTNTRRRVYLKRKHSIICIYKTHKL